MKRGELVEFATYNGIRGSSVKSNKELIEELIAREIFTENLLKDIQKENTKESFSLKTLVSICEKFLTEKGETMYRACFGLRNNYKIEPPVLTSDVLTINDLLETKIFTLFDSMNYEVLQTKSYKSANGLFGEAIVRVYSDKIERITMVNSTIIHSDKTNAKSLKVFICYSSIREDGPWSIRSEEEYEDECE